MSRLMFFIAAVALLGLASAQEEGSNENTETTCTTTQVYDVSFIIDGSGSVDNEPPNFWFDKQVNFTYTFAQRLDVGLEDNKNTMGVIQFSNVDTTMVHIPISGDPENHVRERYDSIVQNKGKTFITAALELADQELDVFRFNNPQRNSQPVIVILTDGVPTGDPEGDEEATRRAAEETVAKANWLKNEKKIKIFSVSIGPGADAATIYRLGSDLFSQDGLGNDQTSLDADEMKALAETGNFDSCTTQDLLGCSLPRKSFWKVDTFEELAQGMGKLLEMNTLLSPAFVCNVEVVNAPPFFCGDTPFDNSEVPVCVGKMVEFVVEVCDDNTNDEVTIDFMDPPAGVLLGENEYFSGIVGRKNLARRIFTLQSDQSLTNQDICFQGTDNVEDNPLKTLKRCVHLSMRYPPRFIDPTPIPLDQPNGDPVMNVKVCEEKTFEVHAADNNDEDNVSIFVLEDPGLPNGAVVSVNVCPPAEPNADSGELEIAACNPVHRFFSWTPAKTQEGKTYRVCFIARDNQNFCFEGGYYSLPLFGKNLCMQLEVASPAPRWVAPTPTHMSSLVVQHPSSNDFSDNRAGKARLSYVGCLTSFDLRAEDDNYCVKISATESQPLPPGAEHLHCSGLGGGSPATTAACNTDQQWNCHFEWVPKRGQEGQTFTTCFHASDNICDKVLHDGNLQSDLPDIAHATAVAGVDNAPLCIPLYVVRCRYCVQEGDTLGTLNRYYHLDNNWLRLWNSNGNDDRLDGANLANDPDLTTTIHDPDMIMQDGDVINVGPQYTVQVGDTLVALASRFKTTVKLIMSVNPDNDGELRPGQNLCIMPCSRSKKVFSY